MIRIKSRFGPKLGKCISKKGALVWAKRKMSAMTMGTDEQRLIQINKFLVGIQFTSKELS